MQALSAKIISLHRVLRRLWNLPIFPELYLLLEVVGSLFWRTRSPCWGPRRPWLLPLLFWGNHHGSTPACGLVNFGYYTWFQHSIRFFFCLLMKWSGEFSWNCNLKGFSAFFGCYMVTVLPSHHCLSCQVCLWVYNVQLAPCLAEVALNLLSHTFVP